jgi:hypothetical protein
VAGAAGLGGYAWQVEPHWVETVRRRLPLAGLPAALHGATVMQLSDLHVGRRVSEDYLRDALERAALLRPDIVVVTGDFIAYDAAYDWTALDRVLRRLPRGRLATVGIPGNHDYGRNWAEPRVCERVAGLTRDHGLRLLRNEAIEVAGLLVVGLDDLWGPRFDPAPALAEVEPVRDALVLCHNPDAVDLPALAGIRGWVLAGHTHGGQCRPPFLPPPVLPVRNRRYTAGEFAIGAGRRLYINRALGHLLQVRFNVRPEITLFTLEPGGRDGPGNRPSPTHP